MASTSFNSDLCPLDAPPHATQQYNFFHRVLFKISQSRIIFIAEIAGAAHGIGSEFVLHCDMRFAAKGHARLGQPEITVGLIPGAGGIEYLVRLQGRASALQYMLSAEDVDAITAERIGWVNQAFDLTDLRPAVQQTSFRMAGFPSEALSTIKQRVNLQTRPQNEDLLKDVRLFTEFRKNLRLPDLRLRSRPRLRSAMKLINRNWRQGRVCVALGRSNEGNNHSYSTDAYVLPSNRYFT